MPPLMVSVWDPETRLSLAACSGADGNEVAATLAALKTVSLKGWAVTGDALHCHPEMARDVCTRGGHYVFTIKANHGPLLAAVGAAFAAAETGGNAQMDDNRGRRQRPGIERRRGCVFAIPTTASTFPGLALFGRIDSVRTKRGDRSETKTHYVVMSRLPAWRMLSIVRQHWSVENDLHRRLDVVFGEDDTRTRRDNAPGDLSVIRRIALDILSAPASAVCRPENEPRTME